MLTLLNEEFFPVTGQFGVVRAPAEDLVDAAGQELCWRLPGGSTAASVEVSEVSGSLQEILSAFGRSEKILWEPTSVLVVECGSWSAWFENSPASHKTWKPMGPREFLGVTVGSIFAKETSARSPLERLMAKGGRQGRVHFHVNPSEHDGGCHARRLVEARYAAGSWVWTESGGCLPFEDTTRYGHEVIRQRLTSLMLNEYCNELGIRPFDEDFYGSRGLIVRAPGATSKIQADGQSFLEFQGRISDFSVGEAADYVES